MADHSDRTEELIAAAVASDLSALERAELDALRVQAPQRRPRRSLFALVAAGCVVAGAGGTLAVQQVTGAPPDGPPGTYGAVEDVAFAVQPSGVAVDGSLIAHTWGTETVLEIEGLQPGETFVVVLVAEDGEEFASGTFFGSEVLIDCRMNAAVMRDEVDRVEITADDGEIIARAQLPEAIDPEVDGPDAADPDAAGREAAGPEAGDPGITRNRRP